MTMKFFYCYERNFLVYQTYNDNSCDFPNKQNFSFVKQKAIVEDVQKPNYVLYWTTQNCV